MSEDQANMAQVCIIADQAMWDNTLQPFLEAQGWQGIFCSSAQEFEKQLTPERFCVIIGASAKKTLKSCKTLKKNHPELFVVLLEVTEDIVAAHNNGIDTTSDVVVSMTSPYWQNQLATLLMMAHEKHSITNRIAQLEDEVRLQKRLNSEIEVLKNAIVRNVSHELRTPLLQVKSAVSLLKEEAEDIKLITYAENATARLETHVTNITLLGHSLDISLNPIILRDSIEYARRNLRRIWERKGQADRIELNIEGGLSPVLADKQGLSTVLQLLMDNALKFSDKSIRVIAKKEEDKVRISVQDFGIGIESDKLQDIFESFYQIDSSSTRRYGGAGVGLALVKLILDHHNTDIFVESVVGEGSTFSFLLPNVEI